MRAHSARDLWGRFWDPALAPIVRDGLFCRTLAAAGVIQLMLGTVGRGLVPCPVWELFHAPCPGCGMTRASLALMSGEWGRAMRLNAMAGAFLVGLGVLLVGTFLGSGARARFARRVEAIERRGFPAQAVAIATLLYWIVRLIYLRPFGELMN